MNGARLTLHAGAREATRAEVANVFTPDATETWQPVPHVALIDALIPRLESIGLKVAREQHGLARDGQRWFGVFDLEARTGDKDYSLAVGLRNTHDQSFAAAALMGSRVWICDNLAMSGEVQFVRKHTSEILRDLPGIMDGAVVKLSMLEQFQALRFDHYRKADLTDKDVHHILVQSVRDRALPVTRLTRVLKEWESPRHEEFAPRTAYSLFNGYTEVYKGTSLFKLPARTQRLHVLFDRVIGVPTLASVQAEAPTLTMADLQARAAAAATN